MKKMICLLFLPGVVAACGAAPGQSLRAGNEVPRREPGARCDFDDQCGSGICDAYACRGPAPRPSGCSAAPSGLPVAFALDAAEVTPSSRMPEETEVVATHVVPQAGVNIVAEGDGIGLRFATTRDPGVALALDPQTLEVLGGEAPPVAIPSTGSPGPVRVELSDHSRLVAWTEGSVQMGYRVRATTVSPDGSTGAPIDLGDQGSAVGRPAVAVTRAGSGVVAFIESSADGFQLVVAHLSCARP
jgi:hypothetical protein